MVQAHSNASQYMPLLLICIALLEAGGSTPAWLLHLYGELLHFDSIQHLLGLAASLRQHAAQASVAILKSIWHLLPSLTEPESGCNPLAGSKSVQCCSFWRPVWLFAKHCGVKKILWLQVS